MNKKSTLWNKNFTLMIVATTMGAVGGITVKFALSFLIFDETGSTFAAGLLLAVNMVPNFLIPLIVAPHMDRMPRKPFLVGGDAVNGIMYVLAGIYLMHQSFSYIAYMIFSLFLSSLSAFDTLAYNSIYPKLIPEGFEQKGYAVSSMLYPTITVIVTPLAAILYEHVGIAYILLGQGCLSVLAALVESRIRIVEQDRRVGGKFSFRNWAADLKEAAAYLKKEGGLFGIYSYMAVTNGVASGYASILVAFFRTVPGFSLTMYSAFSIAEFMGRTIGGLLHYNIKIPEKKRFSFAFFVYQVYEFMDMILLWIPYPLMLINRAICGFLGVNSATLRQAAVQRYIPDEYRAKLNAFNSVYMSAAFALGGLLIGAIGEVLDYRVCLTLCGAFACLACWIIIWGHKKKVTPIYNYHIPEPGEVEHSTQAATE